MKKSLTKNICEVSNNTIFFKTHPNLMKSFEFCNHVQFHISKSIEKSISSKGITQFPATESSTLLLSRIFAEDRFWFIAEDNIEAFVDFKYGSDWGGQLR